MWTIEGYAPNQKEWLPAGNAILEDGKIVFTGENEFDTQYKATKTAWRFRVLLQVPVRLLQNGEVLWSDPTE